MSAVEETGTAELISARNPLGNLSSLASGKSVSCLCHRPGWFDSGELGWGVGMEGPLVLLQSFQGPHSFSKPCPSLCPAGRQACWWLTLLQFIL